MKRLIYLFLTLFIASCSGGGDGGDGGSGGGGGGGGGSTPQPPGKATLTAPANNKVCETGTSISDTQSNVDFSWSASANTSTYDLKIINLEANTVINKNGLTTTNTTVALNKGAPYSWQITSKNSQTTQTAASDTWKFYLAGASGETSYAPFPADLLTPKSESSVSSGSIKFEWEGSDADSDDSLTYDLYLDTSNPPANKVKTNLSSNSTNVTLDAGTYYWKIVTKDSQGSNSDSGVSMFKAVD